MIGYTNNLEKVSEKMLHGFFVGWPNPPSLSAHLKILKSSYCVWLAIDVEAERVVGFITAISDGCLSAYIPLIEVLPEYQKRGIGKELLKKMLNSLENLYMVDLLCDIDLQKYYKQFGMIEATGAFIRNYDRQNCE